MGTGFCSVWRICSDQSESNKWGNSAKYRGKTWPAGADQVQPVSRVLRPRRRLRLLYQDCCLAPQAHDEPAFIVRFVCRSLHSLFKCQATNCCLLTFSPNTGVKYFTLKMQLVAGMRICSWPSSQTSYHGRVFVLKLSLHRHFSNSTGE